jgi:hypothetical protein
VQCKCCPSQPVFLYVLELTCAFYRRIKSRWCDWTKTVHTVIYRKTQRVYSFLGNHHQHTGCPYNSPPYNLPPYSSPPYNSSLFNSSLWQIATLTTRHSDNSPPWELATMTTCHPDNSPPIQLVTMAYMPGSVSLFWLFFTSMFALYTASQIFHSIFCRFFVRINEIQHLLLPFDYVISIYLKLVILYWRNAMVAKCNGGEM